MKNIRNSILSHVRLRSSTEQLFMQKRDVLKHFFSQMCTSTDTNQNPDQIMDRVIGLVKKFDRVDASKVINSASS